MGENGVHRIEAAERRRGQRRFAAGPMIVVPAQRVRRQMVGGDVEIGEELRRHHHRLLAGRPGGGARGHRPFEIHPGIAQQAVEHDHHPRQFRMRF